MELGFSKLSRMPTLLVKVGHVRLSVDGNGRWTSDDRQAKMFRSGFVTSPRKVLETVGLPTGGNIERAVSTTLELGKLLSSQRAKLVLMGGR